MLHTAELGDLGNRRIMLAKYLPRTLHQMLARLRQDHTPRCAGKKLQTELILELTDLHRDRRLGHIYALCPGGKGPRLGDRKKCLELSDLHNDMWVRSIYLIDSTISVKCRYMFFDLPALISEAANHSRKSQNKSPSDRDQILNGRY